MTRLEYQKISKLLGAETVALPIQFCLSQARARSREANTKQSNNGPHYCQGHLQGSSGGSVQALKKVDMLAQSNVASDTPFRLERQHVHQLVVPCVRDSGIHLHSDSLRWRNHPLCHRPGEKTVVLLGLRLVGSTPTWSNR